jgi:hypothetical protein
VVRACYSSAAPAEHTSVIQALVNGGAEAAIGFKYETSVGYSNEWARVFWRMVCKDGKDAAPSMSEARNLVFNDPNNEHLRRNPSLLVAEIAGSQSCTLYPVVR